MLVTCDKTFLSVPKNLTLWPWPWLLTYFWKNLTLDITFEPNLSVCTKKIETLTLTFDLLLKKLIGYNFWAKRDKAFILHMLVPCDKTFLSVPKKFTFWPWPWLLTYFWKKLNLGYNFWTRRDKAFILQVCNSCDKTFLSVPKNLTLWPWPWLLAYFWKNLTLALTFGPREIRFSYYRYVFLVARPFCWKQNCLRDLDFWPTFEKT